MTQPDQFEPTGAANYDSFAGFANTTQEEWEASMLEGIDTHFSPWSGICLMLESIPFLGDLISMAGGVDGKNFGAIEAIFNGLFEFAEALCTMVLGSGEPSAGTTPTTILSGAGGIFGQITNSPLFTGLLDIAESTGNLVSDIIDGFLKFANLLCGIVTGNPSPDESETTPETILDGFTGIFDMFAESSFISGFIDLATETGSFFLEVIDGIIQFINQLWDIFAALIPGSIGNASPLGLLDLFTTWLTPLLDFVEAIAGVGLDVVGAFFSILTDVLGIFGNLNLGWGSGNPELGGFEDIPLFGGLLGGIVQAITGGGGGSFDFLTSWFEDLMTVFGNPFGLGSGNPEPGDPTLSEPYTGMDQFRNYLVSGLGGVPGVTGASNDDMLAVANAAATAANSALKTAAQVNAELAAQSGNVGANTGVGGFYLSIAPGGAPGAALP